MSSDIRITRMLSLQERLAEEARHFRLEAGKLPPGHERDVLLTKARHSDTAVQMIERSKPVEAITGSHLQVLERPVCEDRHEGHESALGEAASPDR